MDRTLVDIYAEKMRTGAKFVPVVLVQEGSKYWIADGHHRIHALHQLSRKEVEAIVYEGTRRDAMRLALSANEDHGLQRSNQDKRFAVKRALADPEWALLSDRELGALCAVSHTFAGKVRREVEGKPTRTPSKPASEPAAPKPKPKPRKVQEVVAKPDLANTPILALEASNDPDELECRCGEIQNRMRDWWSGLENIRKDMAQVRDQDVYYARAVDRLLPVFARVMQSFRGMVPKEVCSHCRSASGCGECQFTGLQESGSVKETKTTQKGSEVRRGRSDPDEMTTDF